MTQASVGYGNFDIAVKVLGGNTEHGDIHKGVKLLRILRTVYADAAAADSGIFIFDMYRCVLYGNGYLAAERGEILGELQTQTGK